MKTLFFGLVLFCGVLFLPGMYRFTVCFGVVDTAKSSPTLPLARKRIADAVTECKKVGFNQTAENLEAIAKFNDLDKIKSALEKL